MRYLHCSMEYSGECAFCAQGAPAEGSRARCAAVQLAIARWIKAPALEFARSLRRALALAPQLFATVEAEAKAASSSTQRPRVSPLPALASPRSALRAFPPRALVRTLVTRAEVDAGRVRHHFETTTGKSFSQAIQVLHIE